MLPHARIDGEKPASQVHVKEGRRPVFLPLACTAIGFRRVVNGGEARDELSHRGSLVWRQFALRGRGDNGGEGVPTVGGLFQRWQVKRRGPVATRRKSRSRQSLRASRPKSFKLGVQPFQFDTGILGRIANRPWRGACFGGAPRRPLLSRGSACRGCGGSGTAWSERRARDSAMSSQLPCLGV